MKKLNEIWEFLDGKKTAIGAAIMITGNVLAMFPPTAPAAQAVLYVGSAIAGFGLVHKSVK